MRINAGFKRQHLRHFFAEKRRIFFAREATWDREEVVKKNKKIEPSGSIFLSLIFAELFVVFVLVLRFLFGAVEQLVCDVGE